MKGLQIKMDAGSVAETIRQLNSLKPKVAAAAKAGTKVVTNDIFTEAIVETPRDTGALVNSLFYEVELDNNQINSVIGYGGRYKQMNPVTSISTDSYAVDRHEFMLENVNSKWLERIFQSHSENFATEVGKAVRSALAGGPLPVDELPDTANHEEPITVAGSKAEAYREQQSGFGSRWSDLGDY